ncbi:MAG: sensor histidine kinase [Thermoanaerobaculia bacterium]
MSERRISRIPIAACWGAFALILATESWLSMITHGHSPLRLLGYQLAVWSFWSLITPAIVRFTERFPPYPFDLRHWLWHCGAMVAIIPAHIAFWVALTVAIKPYDTMTVTELAPYFPEKIIARFPFEIILYVAVVATAQILDLYSRASRLEMALGDARLRSLEQQIRPHFLFNTLNAASSLVRARRNAEAVDVIAALSDLLRYSLDHAGDQRAPLEKEMAMLERYLEIQRVRFSDRLEFTIAVEDGARGAAVPTLLLQPLAENAVRHGIEPKASPGQIAVRVARRGDDLVIEIFNTGSLVGTTRGIGLTNTEERLRQLYGSGAAFTLREADGGVLARLSIPWSAAP